MGQGQPTSEMTPDNAPGRSPITPRDVAKGAGTTLLARAGGVIDIVAQPLYVWLFGLAGYGLYAVLWAAVNLVENVADLGMTSALQRVVPQAKDEAERVAALRAALFIGVTPCLVIAAFASLFAADIAHWFNAAAADEAKLIPAIALFAWALPLWAYIEIATSALRARRVFGAEIRLRIFWEQVLRLILVVALFVGKIGTMALFIGHLGSLAVTALLATRLLARHYELRLLFGARGMVRPTLFAGLSVLPSNIVARLFGDGPPIALNAWIPGGGGAVAAGLYAIARKLASVVQLVRGAFGYVMAPLASAASKGEAGEVKTIYGFATRLTLAIALPLGVTMIAAGPALLSLFGKAAQVAYPALAILVGARTLEAIGGSATPVLQVTRSYRSQLAGSLIGLAVAGAIVLATMPDGGLTAMAIAMGAGMLTATIVPLLQLSARGVHPYAPPFAKVAVVAMGIALAAAVAARGTLSFPDAAMWPLLMLTLVVTLWLSARFALPVEDRRTLGKAGRKLRLV